MENTMRTTIINLCAVLACLTLFAQEPQRPAAGSLDELFKRLDRNGDGKLTRDKIPRMFDQLDKNKDGVVILEEAMASGVASAEPQQPAGPAAKSSSRAFLDLQFTKGYTAWIYRATLKEKP